MFLSSSNRNSLFLSCSKLARNFYLLPKSRDFLGFFPVASVVTHLCSSPVLEWPAWTLRRSKQSCFSGHLAKSLPPFPSVPDILLVFLFFVLITLSLHGSLMASSLLWCLLDAVFLRGENQALLFSLLIWNSDIRLTLNVLELCWWWPRSLGGPTLW